MKSIIQINSRKIILGIIFIAAFFNGMLSFGINRTFIDMPAWQHVGPVAWATFSRWADLGRMGELLYPLEGLGGTLLSIIAAGIFYINIRRMTKFEAIPVYVGALFALLGILVTTQAAPAITSTLHMASATSLQQALNKFNFWGGIRACFQSLAFLANLWTLVVVSYQLGYERRKQ